MQASDTPFKIPVPFANDPASRNSIPTASQIGITPGAASLTDGFPPLTRTPIPAGGVPPFGKDMNGAMYQIAAIARWLVGGGRFAYDSAFSTGAGGYPAGAVVMTSDGTGAWRNVTDNNTTNPDTGGAGWVAYNPVGVTGESRNAKMSVTTASATATFTADEIVISKTLGGQSYRLGQFSQSINLGTVGAGGMDVGAAPINGYVAIYAAYNAVANTRTVFGVNASSAAAPEVYGGANIPSGFAGASTALVSVWITNGSGQFIVGEQQGRHVTVSSLVAGTFLAALTNTPITLPIPYNAKSAEMSQNQSTATGATLYQLSVGSASPVVGGMATFNAVIGATGLALFTTSGQVFLATARTIYATWQVLGGTTPTLALSVSGYTF